MPGTETKESTFRMRALGRRIPNLVVTYDSGTGHEFRVQCEVELSPAEASQLKQDLEVKTKDSLKRAKALALAKIDQKATGRFKKIVEDAFEDNIEDLDNPQS